MREKNEISISNLFTYTMYESVAHSLKYSIWIILSYQNTELSMFPWTWSFSANFFIILVENLSKCNNHFILLLWLTEDEVTLRKIVHWYNDKARRNFLILLLYHIFLPQRPRSERSNTKPGPGVSSGGCLQLSTRQTFSSSKQTALLTAEISSETDGSQLINSHPAVVIGSGGRLQRL